MFGGEKLDRKKLRANELGLTLIEGMVAAAVVGLGFVAVFNLSTVSTNILLSSIDREKGSMLTTMIMEDMLTDSVTINSCATTCPYQNMDFKIIGSGSTTPATKQTKWHGHANKLFGTPTTTDKRLINVSELMDSNNNGTGVLAITIEINSRDGRAKNVFRRTLNAWAP